MNATDLHELQTVLMEIFKTLSLMEAIAVVLLVKLWGVLKVVAIIRGDEHCSLGLRRRASDAGKADHQVKLPESRKLPTAPELP